VDAAAFADYVEGADVESGGRVAGEGAADNGQRARVEDAAAGPGRVGVKRRAADRHQVTGVINGTPSSGGGVAGEGAAADGGGPRRVVVDGPPAGRLVGGEGAAGDRQRTALEIHSPAASSVGDVAVERAAADVQTRDGPDPAAATSRGGVAGGVATQIAAVDADVRCRIIPDCAAFFGGFVIGQRAARDSQRAGEESSIGDLVNCEDRAAQVGGLSA